MSIQTALPEELSCRSARLGEGVDEMNRLIKSKAGLPAMFAPKARGALFIFPKASAAKAKVAIAAHEGKQFFEAGKNGRIKIKLEKTLPAENPEVELSEKVLAVVPDIG